MPYVISPDAGFIDHMTACADTSKAAADATMLIGQRKWMYPPVSGWDGDPYDIIGMNFAFNRTVLNNLYVAMISELDGNGTIGETMVVKLQIDYIAAMERAFRTRHCSSVRAKIHAAGRRRGQGDNSLGLFTGNLLFWLNRLILAAHDDPPLPTPP